MRLAEKWYKCRRSASSAGENLKKLMKIKTTILVLAILGLAALSVFAQAKKAAPDYKITNIKVTGFSESSGQFGGEITGTEGEFFNRLDLGLFVTFEVSGSADSFEAGRKLKVTVMEGKKLKLTKLAQVGYMGDSAKVYYGVWLEPSMCSTVTISAHLMGQKTPSKMSTKIPFVCGE